MKSEQAGGFIQGDAIAGAGGGREELFGEHRSPFRDPPGWDVSGKNNTIALK
jgi:hypothetical protein